MDICNYLLAMMASSCAYVFST